MNKHKIKYGFFCATTQKFYQIQDINTYDNILKALGVKDNLGQSVRKATESISEDVDWQSYYSHKMDEDVNEILQTFNTMSEVKDIQMEEFDF